MSLMDLLDTHHVISSTSECVSKDVSSIHASIYLLMYVCTHAPIYLSIHASMHSSIHTHFDCAPPCQTLQHTCWAHRDNPSRSFLQSGETSIERAVLNTLSSIQRKGQICRFTLLSHRVTRVWIYLKQPTAAILPYWSPSNLAIFDATSDVHRTW